MSKATTRAIIIAAVIVLGSGAGYALVNKNNSKKASESLAMKHDEAMKKVQTNSAITPSATNTTGAGSYSDYDQAKLANALTGKVVLNFSAPWCPICREADKNFKASKTPDGLTLLKVDYDSSTALKRKYGVTYQHTFVQVDKDGNLLKKWSGSTTYDDLQKQTI